MKAVRLQFGKEFIEVKLPDSADVLTAKAATVSANPSQEIYRSLDNPIGTVKLSALSKGKNNAVIVVSDNTRPVPYKGSDGILSPIIDILKKSGIKKIAILVACGTHRAMLRDELREMLGDGAFQTGIEVINHIATDEGNLVTIGSTNRTPKVAVSRHYINADLKIITGLVEPHFMAGFSGGRKAICPGICGQSVTFGFHSASILNDENARSLVLEGNPCHDESLTIAKMAGADFAVNVTINSDKKITGVFCGELEKSHMEAVRHLRTYAAIDISHPYEVIITHAGSVGINHYQTAKAAFEASRAASADAKIVLTANLTDIDPIGGGNYKAMMKLLKQCGARAFLEKILSPDWTFVPEQWQTQMWAKVFLKTSSPKNLYMCAPQLRGCDDGLIPEINVADKIAPFNGESNIAYAQRMTQQTIDEIIKTVSPGEILVLPDGPYAIPTLK